MLDINKVKDDISTWHAETVKAMQALEAQGREMKQLRADLAARDKSLAESQALNERLQADLEVTRANAAKQLGELRAANQTLAEQARTHREMCANMAAHPDVKKAAAERAKADAEAAERLLAVKRAEAERLAKELEPAGPVDNGQ